jgi:hypothetical protein
MLRQVGSFAVVFALAAGSAWAAIPPPQDFTGFLVEGYRQMAEAGQRSHDPRQPFFQQRAVLAAHGEEIQPVDPDKRFLDSWTLREADFARRQLLLRLDAGARQKQPLLAAIAQVNFDCWVAPTPKKLGATDSDECRRRFYFAFAGLVPGGRDLRPEGTTVTAAARPTASRPLIVTPLGNAAPASGSPRPSLASIVLGPSQPIECDQYGENCVLIAFTGPSADVLIHELREGGDQNDGAANGSAGNAGAGGGDSVAANAGSSDVPASDASSSSSSADTSTDSTSSTSSGPGKGKGHGKGHGNGKGKGPG